MYTGMMAGYLGILYSEVQRGRAAVVSALLRFIFVQGGIRLGMPG